MEFAIGDSHPKPFSFQGGLIAPDLVIVPGRQIGVYEQDTYPFITAEIATIAACRVRRRTQTLGAAVRKVGREGLDKVAGAAA
ncbi:MAG: hypothetical protein WBF58_08805 [Xanthobacteraceae bacterium]